MGNDEKNLHLLHNVKAKHNNKVSIDDVLTRIRTGGNDTEEIKDARKHRKGTPEYDEIKLNKIGCWLPHAICNGYPFDTDCFQEFTGFIFLDRDDLSKDKATALKEELSNNKYVLATWLSLSETGIGALVQVNPGDLTKENFKQVYKSIAEDIIGKEYYDKRCNDIVRKNILSHDPAIIVNDSALPYSIEKVNYTVKDTIPKKINSKVPPADNLLFGNIFPKNEFEEGQDYIFVKEKYDNYQIWLPKIIDEDEGVLIKCIKDGERHKKLNSILVNMVAKNGIKHLNQLYNLLADINNRFCSPPKTEDELKKIFNNVIDLYREGKLTSEYYRKSHIKWKEGNRLTAKEKQQITGREMGKYRKEKTHSIIEQTFQDLMLSMSDQPTQKQVAEQVDLSTRQVKKYWHTIEKEGGDS